MHLPEGKTPGYYAQIVKGLAARIRLLDRDKELLVLEQPGDRDAVLEVLSDYKVPSEELELYALPEDVRLYPAFTDYGFTSRQERSYLYAEQTVLFRPEGAGERTELHQLLLQLEEHLIASWGPPDAPDGLAADRSLTELMEGLARAYGFGIRYLMEE